VFVYCTVTAEKQGNAGAETLLSVGNPSFDRKEYPELDDLPCRRARSKRNRR
jgi:hypothetical protein